MKASAVLIAVTTHVGQSITPDLNATISFILWMNSLKKKKSECKTKLLSIAGIHSKQDSELQFEYDLCIIPVFFLSMQDI